jgi:hypothetical protein
MAGLRLCANQYGQSTMTENERRTTTVNNPFIISNPSLAFVNLAGNEGKDLMAKDRAALEDIFRDNIQIADRTLPRCNVLFLYCSLETSGRIAGTSFTFRDLIKGAGAHIAVLASGVPSALLSNPEFMKTLPGPGDWPANVVITLGAAFWPSKLQDGADNHLRTSAAWERITPLCKALRARAPAVATISRTSL